MDDNGHGTHVAGIIGSSDATYTGIAPDVNFVALKVLDSTGSGTFGAVDEALQWVAAHQAQYHIVAVNLSLGSGNFTVNPYPYLESDFSTLKGEGVFVACASGNSFYTVGSQQGLAYPAISPQVVSVGAVWDGNFGPVSWVSGARDNSTAVDQIASFTQRSGGLSILAPGAMITSTYLHNTFKQMAGTSMATPVVAGSAVLLHQALDAQGKGSLANEDYMVGLMQATGVAIVDNNSAADNVVNTGLSFKRLDLFAALARVGAPANHSPPTLGSIPNQTMTAGVPLVVTLPAAASSGLKLSFQAQTTSSGGSSQAYQLGRQLGLGYAGSYFLNSIGQNEKWILGSGNQWYCLMPNGAVRRWMGNAADTLAASSLVTTLTPAVYNDPSQLWTVTGGSNPNATFSFAGNLLTIQCDPNYLGSFTVQVTAGDGIANVSQSFTVTVTRRAATLGVIADQAMSHGQRALTVSLPITNPDNDALAFSARVLTPSVVAYNLDQALGLYYTGNYWIDFDGSQEKWLAGTAPTGRVWYCLLPDGELRRAGNSAAEMLAASSLVATLDSSIYQEPSLLWNAPLPATPSVSFAFAGNQMTLTPAASMVGTYGIEVSFSAGQVSSKQIFSVTITNSPPALGAIANQTVARGKSLTVSLSASDADNDALSWAFQTVTPSQKAISLAQNLGLTYTGNYWTNYDGLGEKWLKGAGGSSTGQWYCLLPNGELRRAGTGPADMLSSAALVGTLDPSYYVDPSLLWNAAHYVAPQVAYSLAGNQLIVVPPANFAGSFVVQATVSDGVVTAKRYFLVTVTA
jgi:subtilisin family serine protease